MKRLVLIFVTFLSVFTLVACKSASNVKVDNAKKVIEFEKNYLKKQYNTHEDILNKNINYYVWEDDNVYYLLTMSATGFDEVAFSVSDDGKVDFKEGVYAKDKIWEKAHDKKEKPLYEEVNTNNSIASLKAYTREIEK